MHYTAQCEAEQSHGGKVTKHEKSAKVSCNFLFKTNIANYAI